MFNGLTFFNDWEEPFYAFTKVGGKKVFVAQDKHICMWADATNPKDAEIIIDLIENSIWTPYSIIILCETEKILYGIVYMRFVVRDF